MPAAPAPPPPPPERSRPSRVSAALAFGLGVATVAVAAFVVWFLVRDDGEVAAGVTTSVAETTTAPDAATVPETTAATSTTAPASTTCANATFGFTLAIPPGWEGSDGANPGEECRFVERPGGGPPTIIVEVETDFSYAEMKGGFAAPSADESLVALEEFTTAGGYAAVRAETALVSGAIAGARRYHIIIDRPDPLWFFVQTEPTTDAATFQGLVEAMHALADTVVFS